MRSCVSSLRLLGVRLIGRYWMNMIYIIFRSLTLVKVSWFRRRGGTDQDRATGARFDQRDAPQDHRAHHFFAERGFRDEQRVQLRGIDLERFGLSHGNAVDER